MITTAGYRCPDKQNAIGWWEPSSHMRGNGMDFDTPDSPDDTVYNNLRTTAKNHNACVEPRAQSLNHIHIDWNDYTYREFRLLSGLMGPVSAVEAAARWKKQNAAPLFPPCLEKYKTTFPQLHTAPAAI